MGIHRDVAGERYVLKDRLWLPLAEFKRGLEPQGNNMIHLHSVTIDVGILASLAQRSTK